MIWAEADQAKLAFEGAFRAWNNNGQLNRYLLARGELRQIIQHRENFLRGEERERKSNFLRLSLRKRTRNRFASVLLGLLLIGGVYTFWLQSIEGRLKADLAVWLLPRDLYTYQDQLETLNLYAPIAHLKWLKADLKNLTIKDSNLSSLNNLPKTLTTLTLDNNDRLTSLAGLEKLPALTTLEVSNNDRLTSLPVMEGLPLLTKVNLRGTPISDLKALARLQNIELIYLSEIDSIDGLPKSVTDLHLSYR